MAKYLISVDIWRISDNGQDHKVEHIFGIDETCIYVDARDIASRIAQAYQSDTEADQE